ncbi:lysozyme inhibitor LprI family protein [Acinetobacter soli]|uniref:lysozyme inhibitor LprI family protein n=1 Tax=Acinetobacter soli TaxID=487316 RepID=UPI00125D895A|nr:lysozyme inhibitor LprI family protein [Acinetobacter soli]
MTTINKKINILILSVLMSSCVHADQDIVTCKPNSVVFNDILNCFLIEFKKVDKDLNFIYQKKMEKLSEKDRIKLKISQRNWIKKKENLCVANEEEYGRGSHFEALACQTKMTKERILFLKNY